MSIQSEALCLQMELSIINNRYICDSQATFPEYRRYDLNNAALKSPQSMAHDSKKSAFLIGETGLIQEFYETW